MEELIVKTVNGDYSLTPTGEKELYFLTTRKLLQYYLKEVLKKDINTIAEMMGSLSIFIFNNFTKIEHYLQKLPDLAAFIQESNLERFQKFMGQYFISTLQKEKQSFINNEAEKLKDVMENPHWAPSNELLKVIGAEFLKSPPLKINGNALNATPEIKQQTPENASVVSSSTEIEQSGKPDKPNAPPIIEKTAPPVTEAPGIVLLNLYGNEFNAASPLQSIHLQKPPEIETPPEEIQTLDENLPENQNTDFAPKQKPAQTVEVYEDPAGIRLLKEMGEMFTKAPKLELSTGYSAPVAGISNQGQRIITLKDFASLINNVSKFTKNKDNAGYQIWYNSLTPIFKGALKINSLYNNEKKGLSVNWGHEVMHFAATTNVNKDELYSLVEDIKLYLKVIHNIRHRLMMDEKIKLSPQTASNIYTQSIYILSGSESADAKKASIRMLLLQITNNEMQQILASDFEKIIHALS